MRKFLLKVILFFAIVAVLDIGWGTIMDTVLDDTNKGDWGRRNFVVNQTQQDVLIFGSSKALHHYDPQIIADILQMSCYNCGEDGTGILSQKPRIDIILERYKPKIIIYDIIANFDLLDCDNTSFLKILRPFCSSPTVLETMSIIDTNERYKSLSNFYKYNSSFIEILHQHLLRSTTNAAQFNYSPLLGVMDYDVPEQFYDEGHKYDNLKIEYLSKLADACKKRNVKLIIVASPWYKMRKSSILAPVENMCKQKGVVFLNHLFDNEYITNKSLFKDAAHLNKQGAEKWSTQIGSEIKNTTEQDM